MTQTEARPESSFTRILANGHEIMISSKFGIESQTLQGFSDEVVECVCDFLHAKHEGRKDFVVKPQIALDVLKLAQHFNIN